MKKVLIFSILLNSTLYINAGHSNINKCIPEYVTPILQEGKLSNNGDFISQNNNKRYALWVNGAKMNMYDKKVESNLNSSIKENVTTKWHPSKNKADKSDEYCEVNIKTDVATNIKLFPHAYD